MVRIFELEMLNQSVITASNTHRMDDRDGRVTYGAAIDDSVGELSVRLDKSIHG